MSNPRVFNPLPPAPAEPSPPADSLEPGAFPVHALNPAMRAMVEDVARVYRVPVQLAAMTAVATVSGALGNVFKLTGAVDGHASFGNLFVIPAAPKSGGNGGTASALVRPLLEASAELAANFATSQRPALLAEKQILTKRIGLLVNDQASGHCGRGAARRTMGDLERTETRRELEQAQAKLEAIEPLLVPPSLWVGNATSEAMSRQFARNNLGLFCYSPEGGENVRVLLGKYRGDGKADIDLALSGFSVEPYRTDCIGRGVCEVTPCLSMLLMVQPSILRELMGNEEAFERGLGARLITFIVEQEPQEDDGITRCIGEQTEAAWSALVKGILARREALAGNPQLIRCTPGAREVFRHFHNEAVKLRRGEFRDIEADLGRWRENAIRIAHGQCVADDLAACELTEEQAVRGVAIMRWCARSGLQVTNAARMHKRGKRAEELQLILARTGGKETLRNLDRSYSFLAGEVEALAGQFPERFTLERQTTGGRPSDILRLRTAPR